MAYDTFPIPGELYFPQCIPQGFKIPQLLRGNNGNLFCFRILAWCRMDIYCVGRCQWYFGMYCFLAEQEGQENTGMAWRSVDLPPGCHDTYSICINDIPRILAGIPRTCEFQLVEFTGCAAVPDRELVQHCTDFCGTGYLLVPADNKNHCREVQTELEVSSICSGITNYMYLQYG